MKKYQAMILFLIFSTLGISQINERIFPIAQDPELFSNSVLLLTWPKDTTVVDHYLILYCWTSTAEDTIWIPYQNGDSLNYESSGYWISRDLYNYKFISLKRLPDEDLAFIRVGILPAYVDYYYGTRDTTYGTITCPPIIKRDWRVDDFRLDQITINLNY